MFNKHQGGHCDQGRELTEIRDFEPLVTWDLVQHDILCEMGIQFLEGYGQRSGILVIAF